jgi:hypothetical protein
VTDNKPESPAWLMRDRATMATIQGLRRGTATPKGDKWHAMQVQRVITRGTAQRELPLDDSTTWTAGRNRRGRNEYECADSSGYQH